MLQSSKNIKEYKNSSYQIIKEAALSMDDYLDRNNTLSMALRELLSELDYNLDMHEAENRGETRGETKKTRELVMKIFKKGKSAEEIADLFDLDINYVNFGTSRIDDITYYLYAKDDNGKHMYMSESLVNKYLQYMSDRELARNKYIELTKQYNQIVVDINNLEYLVPNDYLSNDWGSYAMDELEGLLVSFKNMLCTLKSLYKEEYKDIGLNPDGSINEDYIKTTIYWHDYYAYINIINQIEIAIDVYASNSN